MSTLQNFYLNISLTSKAKSFRNCFTWHILSSPFLAMIPIPRKPWAEGDKMLLGFDVPSIQAYSLLKNAVHGSS